MKFARLGSSEGMVGYQQGESIGAQKVVGEGHDKQRIGMQKRWFSEGNICNWRITCRETKAPRFYRKMKLKGVQVSFGFFEEGSLIMPYAVFAFQIAGLEKHVITD